ncbi:hypothetical protein AMR72_17235 [Flavobacterium psychrophilum]|nr:hypothetical protein AMR72_17235 [Flavobacterium psychrophilum]AOE54095.1 hypothetical protein ALW18_17225 [Flavobacterium psychrophilum]
MKIIRITIVFIFSLQSFISVAQEANSLREQNGYRESQGSGMIAQLMRWQKFGAKHTTESFQTPQEKMLLQLGIRPTVVTTLANNYEFYGGESTAGNNIPYAMVTDAQGNTYITGGSSNENQPAGDFFTMKVSPQGAILWQVRIPAAKYAVEYGMRLLLDNDGNLVVTGLKWNGSDMDILTVKYSPEGVQLWTTIFNSPYEGIDIPTAIKSGPDGAIYITGISWSGPSLDYITLKYNTNGTLAWQARNNGSGGETWNEATAIAIDNTGNVIVTGYSPNNDGWLNYHTVKYSADGTELWVRDYNYASTDPENPSEVTNSVPRSVTTDSDNNVYVTGVFDTFLGRIGTIKYNAAGEQQWIATYKTEGENTQGWQTAFRDNKLYVAGIHNGNFANNGNVLLSYEPDGTQNWAKETTDLIDAANVQLMFDTQGNPVVAAKGMTPGAEEWELNVAARAKKYSVQGNLIGEAAFVIDTSTGTASMGDLAGIGLDTEGNVYFALNSFYSENGAVYETVKSAFGTTAPTPLWNTVYANTAAPNASMLYPFADGNGNTFSTGQYSTFADGMLNSNYFLVKYNAQGAVAWEKVYNTENGNPAEGILGRADRNGNAFVCLLPQFGEAFKIKKMAPNGQELWETEISLNGAQVQVMEIGADGSVYLGGLAYENENDQNRSFLGIKLSASGEELWRTFIASSTASNNIYTISAGKVNQADDLILTGSCGSGNFMSQNVNLTVVKFNNDGSEGWQTPVAVEGNSSSGTDILISNNGAIYTNGYAQNNETYAQDIVTAKISADGALEWSRVFGDNDTNERSYTLRQFSDGAIAVIGYSLDIDGNINNELIKYDTDGNEVWVFESESMRYYNGFHIDGSDNCYIMNQIQRDPFPHKINISPFPIATLITVDASGNGEEEIFVGNEYAEFYGKGLVPHPDGRLLLAGNIGNQSFFQGLHFFETEHDGSLGLDDKEIISQQNKLGQNYPNPVINSTTIPFYLLSTERVSIKLYSNDGKLIKEIANETFGVGNNTFVFDADGLASGIYFYQITAGKFKQARKMIVVR